MQLNRVRSSVRSIIELGLEKEISFMAASVAFFAFVSLIPLILLIFAFGSLIVGDLFAERAVSLLATYLSDEGQQVLSEVLTETQGRIGLSGISTLVLLWSVLKVFRAIDTAFDRIYSAEDKTSLPRQLANGILVLVTIAAGVVVLVVTRRIMSQLGLLPFSLLNFLSLVFIVGMLIVVLAPLFYVMPPHPVTLREVLPGTATVVVGWILLQQLFGVYAANAAQYRVYGFLGAILLFLLWLYFGALILLSGGVVNAALADR